MSELQQDALKALVNRRSDGRAGMAKSPTFNPSTARFLSEVAGSAEQSSRSLANLSLQPSAVAAADEDEVLANQLYEISKTAKVLTAQVSMHMDARWRKRIFQQLDYLLSHSNWDDASAILNIASFASFLRTVVSYGGLPPPYLTISGSGTLWATWKAENQELSCEFIPGGSVRLLLVQNVDGERESTAWQGPVSRLPDRLRQFDNVHWFQNGAA